MLKLDLTLPSIEENLALDDALLERAEAAEQPFEVLRFWELQRPAVVLGRSSRAGEEVNLPACAADGVPVVRRNSGGAAIVTGPGCLMYAVVLCYAPRPELRMIDAAHRHVLGVLAGALAALYPNIEHAGTSDLAVGGRKVSGNSLRCRQRALLYHGTLLFGMPRAWIARWLKTPPRQPAYRQGRTHEEFVGQVNTDAATLKAVIARAWQAEQPLDDWPRDCVVRLVAEKYSQPGWNLRHG